MQDDSSLRALFESLRQDEGARAPAFHSVAAATRHRSWMWRPVVLATATAGAVLAAVWTWVPGEQEAETMPDLCSLGVWRTPTDVLLETPGRELLRDLPTFVDPSLSFGSLGGSTS